jgi:hypothetical protein
MVMLCSPAFQAGPLGEIPETVKNAVAREYGLHPKRSQQPIVIDQIVPSQLGGANDIANLFPQAVSGDGNANSKDRLETRLHDLVCDGHMPLAAARTAIAMDWTMLYRLVFHTHP